MASRLAIRSGPRADQDRAMAKTFKVGDHVSWNSEAGRVRGKIVKVHKRAVNYKGHIHRATPDDPQYEIKSDKTDPFPFYTATLLMHLCCRPTTNLKQHQ